MRRFLVDDHIWDRQGVILQALAKEADRIAGRLALSAQAGAVEISRDVEERLLTFTRTLRHFPLGSSIECMDLDLIYATAKVIRSLILWDTVVEHPMGYDQDGDSHAAFSRSKLQTFAGCRKAAEVIAALHMNATLQRHAMRAVFASEGEAIAATLSAFIAHVNLRLVETLRGLASAKFTLDEVLPDCDAAFAAQRLYVPAVDNHDRLPEVMVRYLSPLLDVGYRILKNQELLVAPPNDMTTVNANDLICVRSWQQGLIGRESESHRHSLMVKFFNFVQEHGGIVPQQARPLVFESVACFANEFADKLVFGMDNAQFARGVSYVLSAFLISSPQMNPEPRAEIAKALIPVFESSHALLLCGSPQKAAELVAEFRGLLEAAGTDKFDSSLQSLLKSRVMQELLQKLGLVAVAL